jgi:alkylhydroperoxidase family enzyme
MRSRTTGTFLALLFALLLALGAGPAATAAEPSDAEATTAADLAGSRYCWNKIVTSGNYGLDACVAVYRVGDLFRVHTTLACRTVSTNTSFTCTRLRVYQTELWWIPQTGLGAPTVQFWADATDQVAESTSRHEFWSARYTWCDEVAWYIEIFGRSSFGVRFPNDVVRNVSLDWYPDNGFWSDPVPAGC